jgi:beta-lactamase regulating signal transducer with metallopeptidase domain
MHILLIVGSLLLSLVGCMVCLWTLRFARSPLSRRVIEVAGLFMPLIALVLLSALMVHFLANVCFLASPPLDVAGTQALIGVGAFGIAAAFVLNLFRAALLPIQMRRRTWEAPAHLQERVHDLAQSSGMQRVPGARVCADMQPWALVTGLIRPQVVVSSGLVALLDEEELEAVLCHELLHIRHGDLWWTALCGVMRDLTWFIPVTRRLYAQMLTEQETACDDGVMDEPRRLALASALVRVLQTHTVVTPAPHGTLALFSPRQAGHIEARVRRLLDDPGATEGGRPYKAILAVGSLLVVFTLSQVALAIAAMQTMGCDLPWLMMH